MTYEQPRVVPVRTVAICPSCIVNALASDISSHRTLMNCGSQHPVNVQYAMSKDMGHPNNMVTSLRSIRYIKLVVYTSSRAFSKNYRTNDSIPNFTHRIFRVRLDRDNGSCVPVEVSLLR